jgi:hypothetical protein
MSRKPSLWRPPSRRPSRRRPRQQLPPFSTRRPSRSGARSPQPAGTYVPPSRANKSAKTHHLPPAYWETLEELSFRTRDDKGKRIPQERLVAEALNLLFAKYNFPVVREGGE